MGRSSKNTGDAGSPDGRQEITISTRMRLAAGLCVLSVALLFGGFGETVATAETETDGSVSETHSLDGQGEEAGTVQTEPAEVASETNVDTIPELMGALGVEPSSTPDDGGAEGQTPQEPEGQAGPMAIGNSTDGLGVGAAIADEDNNGSDSAAAAAAQQVNEPEVNEPETTISHSPVTEPSPEAGAQNAEAIAPASDPPAQEPAAVTDEVASVHDPAASVKAQPATLVSATAATTDVITALAYFFIAVTDDNVALVKIPGDLLSLLGFAPMDEGATASLSAGAIGGSLLAGGVHSAAHSQLTSSLALPVGWPGMLIAPGDAAALASAGAVVHPTAGGVGASGAVEQHPVGIKAVLADGILPEAVRSVLQHTVDAILAPLSVLALAALASPGVVGLLLLSAAGTFVGYRQARAASMLRAVGISRFVKAGPLGVVRSGGLVALHARPSQAVRRQQPRTRDLLETVA